MGNFWGDVAGTVLGGVGGGLLADQWGNLTKTPNVPGINPNKKPMTASDVALPQDLSGILGTVGAGRTAGINNIYNQAKQRQTAENAALGRRPGANSYGPQRLGVQQGIDQGNLEASLGGILGNTGYQNTLAERDYGQQRQLAEEAAALNKPSLLDEIFQGIGAVGKTGATYYGMKGRGGGGGGGGNGYFPNTSSGGGYNPMF